MAGVNRKATKKHTGFLRAFVVRIFIMKKKSANGSARDEFAAAREAVGRASIPELIELLESPSLRTRFLAEMCLRDVTGT